MSEEAITLPYGEGGYLSRQLITQRILKYFRAPELKSLDDGAIVGGFDKAVMTTDSYVVSPIFFPGGDIGKLAVSGTVNDLLVCGAVPRALSCGFIIEAGLKFDDFEKILDSMARTAQRAGVKIVTGDTKVVERGKGDLLYINTAGVGEAIVDVSAEKIQVGDKIIINGGIAEHGTAIMLARAGEDGVVSDCTPLTELIIPLLQKFSSAIHFMRDPTRGGVAQVLLEIAEEKSFNLIINEANIPLKKNVAKYCELMGFDPLYIANEGKVLFFVDPSAAEDVLEELKKLPYGADSAVIGEVREREESGRVFVRTALGGEIPLRALSGAQYPRIC